jgi:hypothetical protein
MRSSDEPEQECQQAASVITFVLRLPIVLCIYTVLSSLYVSTVLVMFPFVLLLESCILICRASLTLAYVFCCKTSLDLHTSGVQLDHGRMLMLGREPYETAMMRVTTYFEGASVNSALLMSESNQISFGGSLFTFISNAIGLLFLLAVKSIFGTLHWVMDVITLLPVALFASKRQLADVLRRVGTCSALRASLRDITDECSALRASLRGITDECYSEDQTPQDLTTDLGVSATAQDDGGAHPLDAPSLEPLEVPQMGTSAGQFRFEATVPVGTLPRPEMGTSAGQFRLELPERKLPR